MSKDADDHRLLCLRIACEYRNMAVDTLPPDVREYLLRTADLWEAAAAASDNC